MERGGKLKPIGDAAGVGAIHFISKRNVVPRADMEHRRRFENILGRIRK